MYKIIKSIVISILFLANASAQSNISFIIDLTKPLKQISPYIFGTNDGLSGSENWTAFRQGGNRMTGYNWENNASNAGSDYLHNSDNYLTYTMGIGSDRENIPGIVTTKFHENSVKYNAYSLITLQLAGYVAKDKNGPVTESQTAPSARWVEVKPEKGSSFSLTPDLTDDYVYIDEYVNFLSATLGSSNAGGIRGYSLDNEPALWPSTHPRIHNDKTLCKEIVDKGIAFSLAVKNVDSTAEIFGPALFGFSAYTDFQAASDWNTVKQGKNYSWFIDYYLDEMKKAETTEGKRLLDVFDIHWYPEAAGDHRITEANATTNSDINARVQAPRTLWDKTYTENSWIGQWGKAHLPLIPNLLASIDKYYPGTKLSFSEFTYGGENHISGAIAISDVIGIFAKYGVYFGALWPVQQDKSYLTAAYKIYRNYDGNNSAFGDYYAYSKTSDSVNTSIYSSINSDSSEVHIIAINKNFAGSYNGNFSINSDRVITSGKIWSLDGNNTTIEFAGDISGIQDNTFVYTLPAGSINHIVLQTSKVTGIKDEYIPSEFNISTYPNPFNSSCKVEYSTPLNSTCLLDIYDITGAKIKTFAPVTGRGSLIWGGENDYKNTVSSGTYFIILRNEEQKFLTKKVVLLK